MAWSKSCKKNCLIADIFTFELFLTLWLLEPKNRNEKKNQNPILLIVGV